ncbi:MAG: alpha-galactosidase [Lentisphaeria bacterium]
MTHPTPANPRTSPFLQPWVANLVGRPLQPPPVAAVICRRQGWGTLQKGRSIADNHPALCLNGETFSTGFGTHADSEIVVRLAAPGRTFRARAGINDSPLTHIAPVNRIVFSVEVAGREVWTSPPLGVLDAAAVADVPLAGATEFVLRTREINGNLNYAHANWCAPAVVMADGREAALGTPGRGGLLADPPISFRCGDETAPALLARSRRQHEIVSATADATRHRGTFLDATTGLELVLELTEFHDFPAVDWVWKIRNTGTAEAPLLEGIMGLELAWPAIDQARLRYAVGSPCRLDDFLLKEEPLTETPFRLAGGGGRSSEVHLPFFNVMLDGEGLITAVGWSGQWAADFRLEGDCLRLTAGQEQTRLRLHAGEAIRTPSHLALHWQGRPEDGHNLLRQLILKHYTHRPDGQTVPAPITCGTWGGMRTAAHLERIQAIREHRLDYDYYWIDAGWYGPADSYSPDEHKGDWAKHVGNWQVNPKAHPHGLRLVSDAARQAGMKFLLWFEPERAIQGTPLTVEHPEWFLAAGPRAPGVNVLFNLGLPEAREWLTDFISGLITEHGVDCYRQDFNMAPLPYWRQADAPDRQGISEIRHIEGLYAFWDGLLQRHPGLLIDNCASGGRRLDLETTRRSIPLWRSDVQCMPDSTPMAGQVQTAGLAHWIPCSTGGTNVRPGDTYNFRSAMCTGVVFHIFPYEYVPIRPDYPWDWHRKMTADLRRATPCFLGDLHLLTPLTTSPRDWLAYQLHRPDLNEGLLLAFRREESPFSAAEFALQGLDPDTRYAVEDADTGPVGERTGRELMAAGLPVAIPHPRDCRLVFYRAVPAP